MRDSILRLVCVTATAVAEDDVAFAMLQQTFVDGFKEYYREEAERVARESDNKGEVPIVLRKLVVYCMLDLPTKVEDCSSLAVLSVPEKQQEIIKKFLTYSISDALAELAVRETITQAIRSLLHNKDTRNMHQAIESTRFDSMFTEFIQVFRANSAANYQFRGTFLEFVLHCFTHFYYPTFKRNIWETLRTSDSVKREAETGQISTREIKPIRNDDVYIHDMMLNINMANDLLFSHSGQSKEARGITYDIFYLLTLYLGKRYLSRLNAELQEEGFNYRVDIVDEKDRKNIYDSSQRTNKGIASKIVNAKDLVPRLFDYVLSENWSVDTIGEIRDKAFSLGKRDREGKNSPWKDITLKGESSRYLDDLSGNAAKNYRSFDIIFKGVLGVHSLMSALQERGYDIISFYGKFSDVFYDKNIVRYIDYLSSLNFISDMRDLQNAAGLHLVPDEPTTKEDAPALHTGVNHGELLSFHEMVHEYAGSVQNQRANIRNNRYQAFTKGLLDAGKRKQSGNYQTDFDKLHSVSSFMTALPRSMMEYCEELLRYGRLPSQFAPAIHISVNDIVTEKYCNIYRNKFVQDHPDTAQYYLNGFATGERVLQDYSWNLKTAMFPGLSMEQNFGAKIKVFCMYIPMSDSYLFCSSGDKPSRLQIVGYTELMHFRNTAFKNGQQLLSLKPAYNTIPDDVFSLLIEDPIKRKSALEKSLSFPNFMGIGNIELPSVQNALKKLPVYKHYAQYAMRYADCTASCSKLQISFINLIYCMLSYACYIAVGDKEGITKLDDSNARQLIESLLISEFKEENLLWFFENFIKIYSVKPLKQVNMKWGEVFSLSEPYTGMDLEVYNIINNPDSYLVSNDETVSQLAAILASVESIPQRFVLTYNYLNTKLEFLRGLRDAYELSFSVIISDLSTLACELNTKFRIEDFFSSAKTYSSRSTTRCAFIDSIANQEILRIVDDTYQSCMFSFSVLVDGLVKHFSSCRKNICALVDYNVTGSKEAEARLQEFGGAFATAGYYTDSFIKVLLDPIRAKYRVDSAGFLMSGNSYFKTVSDNGMDQYYFHITGRILHICSGVYKPLSFNFTKSEDKQRYKELITKGR